MTLSQVGYSDWNIPAFASGTASSLTVPTGLLRGDLLIAFILLFDPAESDVPAPPSGWSEIAPAAFKQTTVDVVPSDEWQIRAYFHFYEGEAGPYVWRWPTTAAGAMQCDAVRGAARTNPIDLPAVSSQHTTFAGSLPAASQTWAGVTLAQPNEFVIGMLSNNQGQTDGGTQPSGFTLRGSSTIDMVLYDAVVSAAGPTSTFATKLSGAADQVLTMIPVLSSQVQPFSPARMPLGA